MRIWDVSPGYLNRQSLLGEHRELHGLHVIVAGERKGYARHPETLRWVGALDGLAWRHAHLASEMRLRGYEDRTPLRLVRGDVVWPSVFVTEPAEQFLRLRGKYIGKNKGRIPLPRNAQQLWAQHKYSVMARDPAEYRRIGRAIAHVRGPEAMRDLARDLVVLLRARPSEPRLVNTLEHMWGHVRDAADAEDRKARSPGLGAWLAVIQRLATDRSERFLLSSTALSDLSVYLER